MAGRYGAMQLEGASAGFVALPLRQARDDDVGRDPDTEPGQSMR
jgi:hypothetical protein